MAERETSGTKDPWDPQQYERFKTERGLPFFDLAEMLRLPLRKSAGPPAQAADLGCGTGELTRALFGRLNETPATPTRLLGLDTSAAMLSSARQHACPGLHFAEASIEDFAAGSCAGASAASSMGWSKHWDLLFSNAALQWVSDHERLFSQLRDLLAEGGQLAIQVPYNDDHPSFLLATEVAREPRFAGALGGYTYTSQVQPPEWYAALLYRLGFRESEVLLRVYSHPLADSAQVAEWLKSTLLTSYTRLLDAHAAADYYDTYKQRLVALLPADRPYLFTFKRLFIWAQR